MGDIEKSYRGIFEPEELSENPAAQADLILRPLGTPLRLTRLEIEEDYESRSDLTIFVFDPDVPADLIDLWNLRITLRDVVPVNIHWFQDVAHHLRDIIERNYRPLPGNPNGVMIDTMVEFASSISEAQADQIVGDHLRNLPKGSCIRKNWYTPLWERHNEDRIVQPVKSRLSAGTADVELFFSDANLTTRFDTLAPHFAERYSQVDNHARWVNVLDVGSIHSESELALCFPLKRLVSDFPKVRTLRDSLVSREGIVLFGHFKDSGEWMEWELGKDAIANWLNAYGITASPSDAGRTTEELIRAVGDLLRTRIFAHLETIKALDDMAARRVVEGKNRGANSTKEYADRSAPIQKWKALLNRRKSGRLFDRVDLDDFIKAGAMRLGLVVQCIRCKKQNWYGLEELGAKLTCERCLQQFQFPQGEIDPKKTPWHYRVVGPFSVPDYAAGGYATTLTLRLFAYSLGSGDVRMTYSTGLDLMMGGKKLEVDFVLWFQRNRMLRDAEEPIAIFGEAKSFAIDAFKASDVANLKLIAQHLPGSFLVLSCLKEQLSEAEKRRVAKLATWGRAPGPDGKPRASVIVLTGSDLFCDWSLEGVWKEARGLKSKLVGNHHVDMTNLWTLADLTQQVHLDLPPYFQWLQDLLRGKKRSLLRKVQ